MKVPLIDVQPIVVIHGLYMAGEQFIKLSLFMVGGELLFCFHKADL